MKCIRCAHDSKRKDRAARLCPKCGGAFAFEPAEGDPVTDMLYKNAIDAVSGGGRLRWGVENLYYEVCRRKRPRLGAGDVIRIVLLSFLAIIVFGFFASRLAIVNALLFAMLVAAVAAMSIARYRARVGNPMVTITPAAFSPLWDRWRQTHGAPPGVIQRRPIPPPAGQPAVEPDIGDYSFDRAVICDRARTVDLLIANDFHFENNCAILSVDGYPQGPFKTIMTMLKRNPKLQVYALHDATPAGCAMARDIAFSPAWFNGQHRVIDLGLRPEHAKPFRGLFQPPTAPAGAATAASLGFAAAEAAWLASHSLELAAVRPEQTLKRLFRGMQAHAADDFSGGGVTNCGSFDSDAAAGTDADGADSFG